MNIFEVIKDSEGKEYLTLDILNDNIDVGNKSEDFEILQILGKGGFGEIFKVISKLNNRVYAMKKLDLVKIKNKSADALRLALNETTFLEGLSHPHIIKYYKSFQEGDILYIIIELAENGDLGSFIDSHKIIGKHLPEEEIWNIFLQCIETLYFIHSQGVLHRDIMPKNIFMDNNKTIKIGDFGASAIQQKNKYLKGNYFFLTKNEGQMDHNNTCVIHKGYTANEVYQSDFDDRADVYSLGVSLYELCFFHIPQFKQLSNNQFILVESEEDKNLYYSKELLNIIYEMLEQSKEKRKDSSQILNMVRQEYEKRFTKNTSIDSFIRCLLSFNYLKNYFSNINPNSLVNKPITQAYINCKDSITKPNLQDWINSINYFRKILGFQNPKLEGNKEIDPRLVFVCLFKEMHMELNNSNYLKDLSNNHLFITGNKMLETNKVEMMLKFVNGIYSKFNSVLSNSFLSLMSLTKTCNECSLKTFSFRSYFFVTLNLEKYLKLNNTTLLKIEDYLKFQNNIREQNEFYCHKCINKTKHTCSKEYYSFPNLLIISIQRGIAYQYNTKIIIGQSIDFSQYSYFQYSKNFYNLIGVLKRIVRNGIEIYYSIIYYNQIWWYCERNNVNQTYPPYTHEPEGDTIMLFYEKV